MRSKFKYRSSHAEMLDSPDVPPHLLVRNLKEMDFLNRTTGGHALSTRAVLSLINNRAGTYRIADLGCGSGDWLRYLAVKAREQGLQLKLTGVDKNPVAISYLKQQSEAYPEISSFTGDYKAFIDNAQVDIYHCSLFCHHLQDQEIVDLLTHIKTTAGAGFVISDLYRSPLAYYGAIAFTSLLGGSKLSRHDGPVSVLRGFKQKEIKFLLHEAGIVNNIKYSRHLFRFLIVGQSPDNPESSLTDNISNYGST